MLSTKDLFTLKMKMALFSGTFLPSYQTVRRCIQEELNLHIVCGFHVRQFVI
jgi:hypothetical protein